MKDRGFYSYICVFVIDLAGVLRVYLTEIQVGTGEKKKKRSRAFISYCR